MNKETRKGSIWKNCITIPNMLSVFRLILIPFFVYAYCVEQNFWKTAALLALSFAAFNFASVRKIPSLNVIFRIAVR